MMWSSDRFCGTRDKASMNDIPEIDIPIYMYRNVSQRINLGPDFTTRAVEFDAGNSNRNQN